MKKDAFQCHLSSVLLLLVVLVLCNLTTITNAQLVVGLSCSEEGTTECATLNRVCRVVNEQEVCGPCQEGYVEFPASVVVNIVDSSTTEEELVKLFTCYEIDQMELALFLDRFQPTYVAPTNLTDEERLEALLISAHFVSEFNRNTTTDGDDVELALNEYAADSPDDAAGLTGYVKPSDPNSDTGSEQALEVDENAAYPTEIDWRELGAVTPVKNQGRCGCCWAISTVGALEGAAAIASGFTWLKTLSHQQFISCDKAHKGCNGGWPWEAFDYADDLGVAVWEEYPYTDGMSGETTTECTTKGKPIEVEAGAGYKVNYYKDVGGKYTERVERLKYALSLGPVAISVKSNCKMLMLYRKGILTDDGDCKCTPDMDSCLDHAILMVGYNDNHPTPYWIIKNSWGFLWGERGYFRVAQLNPTPDNEDSWGLFGVLAEGIIPQDVYHSTGKTFSQNERRPTWWKLMIACIVILCVCVLALIFLYVKEHCFDNRDTKASS